MDEQTIQFRRRSRKSFISEVKILHSGGNSEDYVGKTSEVCAKKRGGQGWNFALARPWRERAFPDWAKRYSENRDILHCPGKSRICVTWSF